MRLTSRLLATALILLGVAASFGCASKTQDDSTIPWSRPATWEGGIPGMGGSSMPGSGYR